MEPATMTLVMAAIQDDNWTTIYAVPEHHTQSCSEDCTYTVEQLAEDFPETIYFEMEVVL